MALLQVSVEPACNSPNQNHLLLQLARFIELWTDPDRQRYVMSVCLLPIEMKHLLDLLIPRRHHKLDDWHEQRRLSVSGVDFRRLAICVHETGR